MGGSASFVGDQLPGTLVIYSDKVRYPRQSARLPDGSRGMREAGDGRDRGGQVESEYQEIMAAARQLAPLGEKLLIGVEGLEPVYRHARLGSWSDVQWFPTPGEAVKAAQEGT
jgi:hypothetical protein